MNIEAFDRAREYLLEIPLWTRKKNSIEAIREILKKLGSPDRRQRIIHVAGTNGKGSVCAFLTSMLVESGYRVGTFVSPHLEDIRERILINGKLVSEETFAEGFQVVKETIDQAVEEGYCHPSFFEYLFYMSMIIFQEEAVDYVVLETGLGGRLDITNAVEFPLASVLTTIGLEHTQYLGDTIEQIAGEKAGIIKRGIPVIFDAGQPAASQVILDRAEVLDAPAIPVQRAEYLILECGEQGLTVSAESLGGQPISLKIPFPARYQAGNALLAFRALEVVHPPKCSLASMCRGLEKTRWPGRMERLAEGVFVDGAHNPQGIQAFADAAAELKQRTGKGVYLLFSAVEDKDYETMIACLCQKLQPKGVVTASLESERGADAAMLAGIFQKNGVGRVSSCQTVKEALLQALEWKEEQHLLFCTGSLYFVGELKTAWKER